ncbi:hypothetical protein CRG98_003736 [Punica granatum]|uniref:Uncharacterized protein n=1 Tax=Punica granatum TaxID=22663 RepID=A0A2I0L531_PUNGR|nr:hypothetical protein CRG98_003736 [Punica granatum]
MDIYGSASIVGFDVEFAISGGGTTAGGVAGGGGILTRWTTDTCMVGISRLPVHWSVVYGLECAIVRARMRATKSRGLGVSTFPGDG